MMRKDFVELDETLEAVAHENPPLASHLARFLVVRSAGYIEFTLGDCVKSFAQAKAHPSVAVYVESVTRRRVNAHPDEILKVLASFDQRWHSRFDEFLKGGETTTRRDQLKFLIDRRNCIAHGQSEGIGVVKARSLAHLSLEVCDELINTFDPRADQVDN